MKRKLGDTRCVFIFEHFVIKVPRIYWLKAFKCFNKTGKEQYCSLRSLGLVGFWKRYRQAVKDRKIREAKWLIERSERLQLPVILARAYEKYDTFWSYLLGGIMANWHEFTFYLRTQHEILAPTYFSLFGLINIQKRGQEIDFWDDEQLMLYLFEHSLHEDQPWCDGHTLLNKKNFCLDNQDKFQLFDYGSRHVRIFISLNGKNLVDNFVKPKNT